MGVHRESGYGWCSSCGTLRVLRKDGLMPRHDRKTPHYERCPGSLCPPATDYASPTTEETDRG